MSDSDRVSTWCPHCNEPYVLDDFIGVIGYVGFADVCRACYGRLHISISVERR
jgi:prepilin signal peptidase PulO-like enzyme (type II secretory pathway)